MTTFSGFSPDTDTPAPTKRRHIDREHSIQKHARMWAAEQIDAPHEFLAFDRAPAWGQWSHMRQKARGVRKGTSDTLLTLTKPKGVWCEFKRPGEEPDDDQMKFGRRMQALGWDWCWADSVASYCAHLRSFGVPLRNTAEWGAEDHDRRVAAEVARAEARAPAKKRSGKPREVRPSLGRVRRTAAIVARYLP